MILEMGESVAQASLDLNLAQVKLAEKYRAEMAAVGLQPTFYHMQTVEAELRLAFYLTESSDDTKKHRSWFGSDNAENRAQSSSSHEGASTLKLTFAPAPPPAGWDEGGS